MSWIDRIQTDFLITTGDGVTYAPNMVNASKNVEYNVSRFEFKETSGTLVVRGTPRGTQYAIEIFFQGEDHLDTAEAFQASAADPRPWSIAHPMYGTLLVQPISLTFDNARLNVTRITGGIVETIGVAPDRPTMSPADKIIVDKATTDAAFAENLSTQLPDPSAADKRGMIENAATSYNAALASIHNPGNVQDFVNTYKPANSALTNAANNTFNTFSRLQSFYSLPLTFQDTVVARIGMLTNMLAYLNGQVRQDMTLGAKLIYEATAGTLISSMVATVVINTAGAFSTRKQALAAMGSILGAYNGYLALLDSIQSAVGGIVGAFIPSRLPLQLLGNLVSYTCGVLLDIGATSRQERTIILGADTNVIIVASELLGLKPDDSTIDELIEINQFGYSDLIGLKKGRRIIYYL